MGWCFTHREKGQSNREWFEQEFSSIEILADATIENVFYAAARNRQKPEEVFGLAILIRWVPRDYYNFGYKDQDETVGPVDTKAPAKVLDLLTPTESEWANEWREKCRAYQARRAEAVKLKKGQTVRFATPIEFVNGVTRTDFVFGGRNLFVGGYSSYRIPDWKDRSFEILATVS